MNSIISQFPSGEIFLKLDCSIDWHRFPLVADRMLEKLQAYNIISPTQGKVVDTHWYEFFWNKEKYRLVYSDWPEECLIEKLSAGADLRQLQLALGDIRID